MKFPPNKKISERFGGFFEPKNYDIISPIISWDEFFFKSRQWKHCHIQYQIMKILKCFEQLLWHQTYVAFTLHVKLMLNEDLGDILGGTQC